MAYFPTPVDCQRLFQQLQSVVPQLARYDPQYYEEPGQNSSFNQQSNNQRRERYDNRSGQPTGQSPQGSQTQQNSSFNQRREPYHDNRSRQTTRQSPQGSETRYSQQRSSQNYSLPRTQNRRRFSPPRTSRPSRFDATLYNFFDGTKYEESFGYTEEFVLYTLPNNQHKKVSLPVVELIEIMFNKHEIDRVLNNYSIDPSILTSKLYSKKYLIHKAKEIYKSTVASFSNKNSVYLRGLNDLHFIQDTCEIFKECDSDPNFFYRYYKMLNTKIRPLPQDCSEYRKILEYATNSRGPTHDKYVLEVMNIFKISRRGEFMKYKPLRDMYGHPKLLWFGTRTVNYPSIFWKGLQSEPYQMPSTGHYFGKGIYLTDVITKAANQCEVELNNPIGLLLLAEVAIGQTLKTKEMNEDMAENLPPNKHSVKGLGKYIPNPRYHFHTNNGVQVPLGKLIPDQNAYDSVINYNEYVVNNPDQVLLQYLVKVKFHFNN